MDLVHLLEDTTCKFPRRIAVVTFSEKLSYRHLNEKVNHLSHGLLGKLKVNRGDRVGILLGNSAEFIISLFAILKIGAIAVPLNVFLTAEELSYVLNNCKMSLLITSTNFLEIVKGFSKEIKSLSNIILTDKILDEYLYFGDIIKGTPKENPFIGVGSDDTALIIYTSGTTGRPKGAMLTHNNLFSNVKASTEAIDIVPRDRILLLLPMFHSFTLTVCTLLPLYTGARIIVVKSVRPFHNVIRALVFGRVTILIGIPQLFKVLKDVKLPRLFLMFLSIRLCISGAAPLGEDTFRDFQRRFKFPLLEGYGLTEASPVVSLNPLGKTKIGSVGLPLPGIEVKVVAEDESELPLGEIGELIVKGPNVMKGYYNLPADTSSTIRGDWLFTGDMAKIDEDGYIYIVDRKKDMIIYHGLNVYPREIEDFLLTHTKIKEVAVIGRKDPRRGEIPVAIIVVEEGQVLTDKEVIDFCKGRLASYKIPHLIEFRPSLPKTPTGKVLKRELA